ncbi:zinc finger protein 263 isoform X7 [Rhizophagus clarus]|uniref:Zinc finger protein 263 isoform X7 n=1 Tax=Rhizophagus clarus TaxID=94130 RepID=A0A8H3L3G3_9GLOM|nr:zinc finger protein 263 isoform X7 [Rhizophagus clarus]
MPKVQRSSYSASEKLKILLYAKERRQRAAAWNFSIDHSMISRRKPQYSEAEASLKIWVIEFQKDGIAVTPKMVKIYMKEILIKEFAHIYLNSENFLASDRWFYGFLKRSGFSLRCKTKIGQKLPA